MKGGTLSKEGSNANGNGKRLKVEETKSVGKRKWHTIGNGMEMKY